MDRSATTAPDSTPDPKTSASAAPDKFPALTKGKVQTLQFNIGRLCNQACHHCHVESSPKLNGPDDNAGPELIDDVLALLQKDSSLQILDITGGAPELNPSFRRLVKGARKLGRQVLVRHNLTVQFQPGQNDLPEFFADQGVVLFCSMPCYLEGNVDAQRGNGVFQQSIHGLKRLNEIGFGTIPERELILVFNPRGATLPPAQAELEKDYRKELKSRYQVEFTSLVAIANQPIHRFKSGLIRRGKLEEYSQLLRDNFNPETLGAVMCHQAVSLRWDGQLFDCDFNLVQGLPLMNHKKQSMHINDLLRGSIHLKDQPIQVANHCFACTAGSGSSCGGSLVV